MKEESPVVCLSVTSAIDLWFYELIAVLFVLYAHMTAICDVKIKVVKG